MFEGDELSRDPGGRLQYFVVAGLLAMAALAVFQAGRYWWWKTSIDEVSLGMSAREVVERLGPLPPKSTVEDEPGLVADRTSSPDVRYCVNYFFFNGGPSVDLCFDSTDTVIHKQAYQWSFIQA
jgi:hypothetical protein